MGSISSAAARDDVYELTELSFAHRSDPAKIAQIVEALEESIPSLDPVRFRGELEHVLSGPDLPELARAKELAAAMLEGRPVPAPSGAGSGSGAGRGMLGRMGRLLRW